MKTLACGASLVLLASACGKSTTPPTDAMAEREAIDLALGSDSTLHGQGKGYIAGDDPLAWREPGFEQHYTAVNFNTVLVTDSVQDPSGGWQSTSHQSSANFSVLHVTSGGLDRYAVFGSTRDEEPVVELWNLVPVEGSVVVQGPGGGVVSPLLVPKKFQKTRIFKGAPNHRAVAFEYDPAGRYVVCALRDPQGEVSLFKIDPQNIAAPPVVLHDSTAIPELNDIRYAEKADHALLGRILVFGTAFASHRRIMLVDSDNDGVFDGAPLVGGDDFFASQGLDRFEDWISLDR